MTFQKGHKHATGGARQGSGRKKSLGTLMTEALEHIDQNFPGLINKLVAKALKGDTEAIKYCLDRRLGKPSFQGTVDITGGERIGVETWKALIEAVAQRKRELEVEAAKSHQIEATGG